MSAALRASVLGAPSATGQVRQLVERRFRPRAVQLTDSGTSALALAIAGALGDRTAPVALPAFCCYDVATAADWADVPVLLYDVDPATLSPDFSSLEAALARGATAVVVAHLYGVPADLRQVERLAGAAGAVVIEDAAQGGGTTLNGRPAGASGSLAVLSFGRGKGLTAGGGGALLAHDDHGMRILSAGSPMGEGGTGSGLAPLVAQWVLGRPLLYGIPASLPFLGLGETVYKPPSDPGQLSEVGGAVLLRTWPLAASETLERRRRGAQLAQWVDELDGLTTVRFPNDSEPGYLRFPLLVPSDARPAVDETATRRLGVMPGYPCALVDLPGFGDRCLNRDVSFRGARTLAKRLVTLPTHSRVGKRDMEGLRLWLGRVARGGSV